MITQSYIYELRQRMRINHDGFDGELQELAEAARGELILAGVLPERAEDESDPLIKQAVAAYLKANFGFDSPDADKYREAFEKMKIRLTLSSDYIETGE